MSSPTMPQPGAARPAGRRAFSWLSMVAVALLAVVAVLVLVRPAALFPPAAPTMTCTATPTPTPTFSSTSTPTATATPAPTHAPTPTFTPAPSSWQRTVNAFVALAHDLEIPPQYMPRRTPEPGETGAEFDVNEYFSVLDHLSMQPGYVLDYVYYAYGTGGEPMLYARPADTPRLRPTPQCGLAIDPAYAVLAHVQTDGTAEGFFQLAVLQLMGEQFYLYWHANYNDQTMVCDRTGLLAAVDEAARFLHGDTGLAEVRDEGERLDLEPRIELTDQRAVVRVVFFTKWGGLVEQKYTFRRSFPHGISNEECQTLVPYQCGVLF